MTGQGHLKALEYPESDQEFLFFTNYSDIYDYLKIKNDFISSLDRKVIDIDVFDSCLNKVYLITTE